jgi:hypothetical protein
MSTIATIRRLARRDGWATRVVLTVGLLFCGGFFVARTVSTPSPSSASAIVTVPLHASWAQWYRDTQSLKRAADVIAVGTFKDNGMTTESQKEPGIIVSDFTFTVATIVADPGHRVQGATLAVRQTGGVVGTTRYVLEDDPLFQPNERAILFLHEYAPGHYYVVGGPSGRFAVQGGIVRPIAQDGIKVAASTTEIDFVNQLRTP